MHRFLTLAAVALFALAPLASAAASDDCADPLALPAAESPQTTPEPALAEQTFDGAIASQSTPVGGAGWSCEVLSDNCLTQYACQGPEGPAHPRVVVEQCCSPPCTNPPCNLQVCEFRTSTTCSC